MQIYTKKLKEIREKTGISVKYIVNKLNISRKTYWNWENGKIVPTGKRIRELARAMNISVSMISNLDDNRKISEKPIDETLCLEFHKDDEGYYNENIFTSIKDSLSILQKKQLYNSAIINVLMNSTNVMFYVKDLDLKYILANKVFIKTLSNLNGNQYFEKIDRDFFTRAEAKKNTEEDMNVMITGRPVLNREGCIPGTRKKRFGLISKFPLKDENSKTMGILATFIDITTMKTEEKKRKTLEFIINNINQVIGFWETGFIGKEEIFINAAVEKVTGIKAEEFYKDPFIIEKHCHPDFVNALKEYNNIQHYPKQLDYKLIRPTDKAERWIRQISYKKGSLRFGIGYDITEEKNNEDIKDLLKIYMDIAKPGISIANIKTGEYLYINNTRLEIYGRNRKEMINGGFQFFLNNCLYDKERKCYDRLISIRQQLLQNPFHTNINYQIMKPDGQLRSIHCEISTARFKGKVCSLYVEYDITEGNCFSEIFSSE